MPMLQSRPKQIVGEGAIEAGSKVVLGAKSEPKAESSLGFSNGARQRPIGISIIEEE